MVLRFNQQSFRLMHILLILITNLCLINVSPSRTPKWLHFPRQSAQNPDVYLLTNRRPEELYQGCPRELMHLTAFGNWQTVCRVQPPLAVVAYEGILEAMEECREQMRFQRWDCSQPATVLHEPTITKFAYRESAYLWAMSAAGAAWGVATACAQGWLEECKCVGGSAPSLAAANARVGGESGSSTWEQGMVPRVSWEWSGCSYGVQYGVTTSRKLLTRVDPSSQRNVRRNLRRRFESSLLRKLEKHNLKVGRLAVKRTLMSSCKCHGVSGSCQQKTCWKKAADLASIAKHLTEKYRRARNVSLHSPDLSRNTELVFAERSIDLCSQFHYDIQQKRSLPRTCGWRNATHAHGDCTDLCCGLGFSVTHEVVPYKCECKFVWCCKVECKECLEHRWISTCNN